MSSWHEVWLWLLGKEVKPTIVSHVIILAGRNINMKKSHLAIIGLSIFAIAVAVALVFSRQSTYTMKTKEISREAAVNAVPYITISEEETAFAQSLLQKDEVKSAIENGTDLSIEIGKELALEILPESIKVTECTVSMNRDVIYFVYSIDDNSVMLMLLLDGRIDKSVPVYSKGGDIQAIYRNVNNELYEKHTFGIFG